MQAEKQFFKFLVLAQMLNMPDYLQGNLCHVSPDDMFNEVKKKGYQFNQFQEWIDFFFKKITHNYDDEFDKMGDFKSRVQNYNQIDEVSDESSFVELSHHQRSGASSNRIE